MIGKKLFIHIPKNGGMSIRHRESEFIKHIIVPDASNTFDDKERNKEFIQNMKSLGRPNIPYPHARWRDIKKEVSLYNDAFAIVRNPWERVISRYTYGLKVGKKWDTVTKDMSLDEFLDMRYKDEFSWFLAIKGWWNAMDYVTDNKDRVRCDIMRFSHYENDVCRYFNKPVHKLHIRNVSNGEKTPNARNIEGRKNYREFYNNKQIQIVADWYKKDIEYWKFDFDTDAQKNYWMEDKE